ncbi:MAG: hypothetical protein ACRD1T_14995 [Acidimicrobiia bacterium]
MHAARSGIRAKSGRRRRILPVIAVALLTGCGTTTQPSSDSTPPTIALDVYSLPPQAGGTTPGAGTPSETTPGNPESFTESCCVAQYTIPAQREISLIAVGQDSEGVRRVQIFFEISRFCENPETDLEQLEHASGILKTTTANVVPSPGAQVPTELLALANFSIGGEAAPKRRAEYPETAGMSAILWASAANFFAGMAKTVEVTFIAP